MGMIQTQVQAGVRFQESDLHLFEQLVQKHEKYAFNIAYRMVGNVEEARDLAQEAFVRAFRAFDRFEQGTSFERWLYRIISNLYIDLVRKKSRAREESLDAPIITENGQMEKVVADTSTDPDALLEINAFDGEIQKALEALPAEYRMAVILCDVQGFSYEEISHMLRCSIGTVRSRIHRGRKQLREMLKSYPSVYNIRKAENQ